MVMLQQLNNKTKKERIKKNMQKITAGWNQTLTIVLFDRMNVNKFHSNSRVN